MDSLLLLVIVVAGVAPLAILAGWLTGHGWSDLGPLVRQGGDAAWRQAVMPWPRGVQEEDGVHWRIGPGTSGEPGEPAEAEAEEDDSADYDQTWTSQAPDLVDNVGPVGSSVQPTRIRPQVRIRPHR